MGVEIERKFLVSDPELLSTETSLQSHWRSGVANRLSQGYLSDTGDAVVRVRRVESAGKAAAGWLTIKGRTNGATRAEFEYAIDPAEAAEMLGTLCTSVIEKTRFVSIVGSHTWEVDEFYGSNLGLIVAEVELKSEDETFERPAWVTSEVTGDPKYYNSNLAILPFSLWSA